MTTPTGPGRRKARLIRDEPLAEDALVVLRAAAADRSRTLRNAIADATESGLTYVIVRTDGRILGALVPLLCSHSNIADGDRLIITSLCRMAEYVDGISRHPFAGADYFIEGIGLSKSD